MIVKLQPALKHYVWGGQKLNKSWGKVSQDNVAESWELSFAEAGRSIIASGKDTGRYLSDTATQADFGVNCAPFDRFPVLVKLIDAESNLSVQVHPSDGFALSREGQLGKTEMWYILDAEPNAVIYLGFNRDLTAEEFASAIRDKTVVGFLNAVPVKKGDTYFVESGTVHAIGAGVTLLEIQQNSTLTYRVYDYDRRDADGNLRPLHIDKAQQVANLAKYVVPCPDRGELLGKCKYFSSYRYFGDRSFCFADSFCSLTVTDGEVKVEGIKLTQGDTVFVSAGERFAVTGAGEYVVTYVERR